MAEATADRRDLAAFDFSAHAGLYEGNGGHRRKGLAYRGFPSAALAIQFAIEEMPRGHGVGAVLEVDEERFSMTEIIALYDSPRFPLPRSPQPAPAVKTARRS